MYSELSLTFRNQYHALEDIVHDNTSNGLRNVFNKLHHVKFLSCGQYSL